MEYTEVLKLRGLPYSATTEDIIKFFLEYELTEENVHIAYRSDGKATGEAFVEFPTAEVAKTAMCKDKMTIGTRYVELFPSTLEEDALWLYAAAVFEFSFHSECLLYRC
jgi:heterogeneous nuclear ribonucleoprotein F/H